MAHSDSVATLPIESSDIQRRTVTRYLQSIAISGIVIVVLATAIVQSLTDVPPRLALSVPTVLLCCILIALLRYDYVTLATHLFVGGGFMLTLVNAQNSYEAFLLATSGFMAMVLAAMVMLPRRHWLIYLVLSLIYMTVINAQTISELPLGEQRDLYVRLASIQTAVFLCGSFLIGFGYRMILSYYEGRQEAMLAMEKNQVLIERRSAELEAANQELSRSEDRYRTLVDTASEAIFLCDYPGWQILDVNPAAERLLKHTRAELIGQSATSFVVGPNMQYGQEVEPEPFFARLEYGELLDFEQIHVDANGDELLCQVRMIKLPNDEGRIRATVIDVTQQRADAEQLRRAEKALQRAQKMESLGVLTGGIAHDFNNLLVAILGQNSIASAKLSDDHPAKRHIERSMQASERASALTKQMLAYSGQGAFEIADLNLNRLIEENLKLFRVSIPSTTTFSTDLYPDLPIISADAAQMQQVVMNLIINAGQAWSADARRIGDASGARWSEQPDICALHLAEGRLEPGNHVVVSVIDNGRGMDDKTRQRIFDPFFTTKESGSGLGLAAVLGIVNGHDGGITVQSDLGVGTTFRLYFPAGEAEVVEPVSADLPTILSIQTDRTVLIIDDDPSVTEAISDILSFESINAIAFNRPSEGIDYYRMYRHEIDLVMIDLMMPEMNGAEVFEALYLIDPTVCVLLSSGYSQQDIATRFVVNGVADFIQKPYNFQQLLDRINMLLARQPA